MCRKKICILYNHDFHAGFYARILGLIRYIKLIDKMVTQKTKQTGWPTQKLRHKLS